MIPKATRGQYELIGSVQGYVRYLRDQAAKVQAGAPDCSAERARFIRPGPISPRWKRRKSGDVSLKRNRSRPPGSPCFLLEPAAGAAGSLGAAGADQSTVGDTGPDPLRHPRGAR